MTEKNTLYENLISSDEAKRNNGFKALYLNPIIRKKVNELVDRSNLEGVEADEILQESIIKLDDNLREGLYKGESKIETYLLGIAKWLIWRKVKERKKPFLEVESISNTPIETPKIEENVDRDSLLKKVLSELPESCHQTIKLYYFESYTMQELATKLGLSSSHMAKKKVSRCRQQLREIIKGNPDFSSLLNL